MVIIRYDNMHIHWTEREIGRKNLVSSEALGHAGMTVHYGLLSP